MPIQIASTREDLALAYGAAVTHVSLHSADPGLTGANEITSIPRQPATWIPGASDGSIVSDTLTFAVPADTTISHLGFWTALTGGTFKDSLAVGVVFVSAGSYVISAQFTVS